MTTIDDVHAVLARITYPGFARDIASYGFVRDVTIRDGHIRITLDVPTQKSDILATLRTQITTAMASLDGVAGVDVALPHPAPSAESQRTAGARQPLPGITHIVAVASGKGGVGKSTVAVNLALALKARGLRVGLLDADVHGPSVPLMTGSSEARPRMLEEKKIVPIECFGIALVSMGFFLDDRSPVIWRGPMVMSIVRQFLRDVVWGERDVLIVDLPPGTGDAQLTLLQEVPIAGGVIVTTPQDVALQDVRRGIAMFEAVQAPVLGIVENMSGYVCPSCGEHDPVFADGGGRLEAESLHVPLLGTIPLESDLRASMDRGTPLFSERPEHAIARTFADIARQVTEALQTPRAHTTH